MASRSILLVSFGGCRSPGVPSAASWALLGAWWLLHSLLGPDTLDEGGDHGVDVGLHELLVDPEQNRDHDAGNAHHGSLLRLMHQRSLGSAWNTVLTNSSGDLVTLRQLVGKENKHKKEKRGVRRWPGR